MAYENLAGTAAVTMDATTGLAQYRFVVAGHTQAPEHRYLESSFQAGQRLPLLRANTVLSRQWA